MRIDVAVSGLRDHLTAVEKRISKAKLAAMQEAGQGLQADLREQTAAAGLGRGVANAWRLKTYDNSGTGKGPAAFLWSKAPRIVDAYSRGGTIRPTRGQKYLWIPTRNVPRARARVGRSGGNLRGGAMTPEEVESYFNADFIIVRGRSGHLLAFMDVIKALNARSYRPRTKRRQLQGRASSQVLMFTLVPSVTVRKRLDLPGVVEKWAGRVPELVTRNLAV